MSYTTWNQTVTLDGKEYDCDLMLDSEDGQVVINVNLGKKLRYQFDSLKHKSPAAVGDLKLAADIASYLLKEFEAGNEPEGYIDLKYPEPGLVKA